MLLSRKLAASFQLRVVPKHPAIRVKKLSATELVLLQALDSGVNLRVLEGPLLPLKKLPSAGGKFYEPADSQVPVP